MLRIAPLLLLGCLLADAAGQTFVPVGRPFDVGISSAYDPVRRRLVLFGDDATTWELDGGELLPRADLAGAATPPRRVRAAMCFDEARRHVLMFGGQSATSGSYLADTWGYDGNRWTQLTTGPAPAARFDAAITWDSVRNRVVMWGGQNGGLLTDTWEHDGTSWLPRTPATVPGPNSGRMTFDRQRGVAVLVTPSGFFGAPVSTWEWNGTNWTLRTSSGPATNANATLAFDSVHNLTVLVGGVPNDLVWTWDGTSWGAYTPSQPFRRLNAASWFDAASGCVAVVGGIEYQVTSGGGVQQGAMRADRWHWNGQSLTLVHDDVGPKAVFDVAMLPDPAGSRVLLFGGSLPGGQVTGETWAYAGGAWSAVSSPTSPSPRKWAATAHDLQLGDGLLFGGFANGVFLGDTWTIGPAGWAAHSTPGPAPRAAAAMAVDLSRGVVVLFGGLVAPAFNPGALCNDTWEWNGSAWTPRPTAVQPPARFDAAMSYHPQLGRVMLFGGRVDYTAAGQLADTWTWDGSQWSQSTPATVPPALGLPSMSIDLTLNRCTLVGVAGTASNLRQQVWSHDGANWLLALDEPAPIANRWFPCVVGPSFDTLVCAGCAAMLAELTRNPGRVATLGPGCGAPGSALLVRSRPRIGTTTGVELVGNANRAALFGFATTGGNAALGNGCTLWLGPICTSLFLLTDASGFANQLLPLPADPTLRGFEVFVQGAVLEPQSPNGLVLTQGLRLTIGD